MKQSSGLILFVLLLTSACTKVPPSASVPSAQNSATARPAASPAPTASAAAAKPSAAPTVRPSATPLPADPNLPEDTELKQRLLKSLTQLGQATVSAVEKTELSILTLEHARQIANNPKDTEYKIQATYDPVPPGALIGRILESGVFPSDNMLNAFLSANSIEDAEKRFTQQIKGGSGVLPFTHVGLGVVKKNSQWFISTILLSEIVKLAGIEPILANPGTRQVTGEIVTDGFSNPSGLVTLPNGNVEKITLTTSGRQFSLNFNFATKGYYSFEINVDGPFGPQPATNFVVAVGVPRLVPQPSSNIPAPQITDVSAARQTLLELLNRDRQAQGMAVLKLDTKLNETSQNHSEDMVANRFIGHNSPTRGTPQQQAAAQGVSEMVAQNISVSRSLEDAQQGLMSSPGHRKIIIDPNHTHVGFGIKNGTDGFLYVTQNFMLREFELDTLPATAAPGSTLTVKGKMLRPRGFIGVFNGSSIVGEPIDASKQSSFSVPVTLPSSGTAKIQVGISEGVDDSGFSFKFYNVWNIKVQ